jgi:transposase
LTLVSSHARAQVVWGAQGRDAATLDGFFTELGPDRSAAVAAVSMDMSAGYEKSVLKPDHAPAATICFDPFHVVALGTKALDTVRREHWQALRRNDPTAAKRFKGARWAPLKRPENLSDDQAATRRRFRRAGGAIWRAYTLREALRAIFAPDPDYARRRRRSPGTAAGRIRFWLRRAGIRNCSFAAAECALLAIWAC